MNYRSSMSVALAAGILIAGCSLAQRAMPGATMSDANVLAVLNTIDRAEIEAGQLAAQKAASEDVRQLATRTVEEHTQMTQQTRQLAQRMNVEPDKPALASTMEKAHRETMEELRGKSGRDFDQAYITYQIKMHEQAIGLVKDTAGSVSSARLQQHLRQAQPDLQSHLSAARAVERQSVAQR